MVVLGAAHQRLRVKAGGGAEQPVILRHLPVVVPPAESQVHGGELLLAHPAHPGGKGVVDPVLLPPLGKAQHPHPLGEGQVHIPQGAGLGGPGRLDDGHRVSLFAHSQSLVFLFDGQPPGEGVAAAAALELRPEALVLQGPAGLPAALSPALGAGEAQMPRLHQGAVQVADVGGLKGDLPVKFRPALLDEGGHGLGVVDFFQDLQGHAAVVQSPVVVHARQIQPQQLRRLGEAHLLFGAQAHALLGVALQVAVPGEEGHLPVAAEVPAVLDKGQDVGGAPGQEQALPGPFFKPAHRLHKGEAAGEVVVGDAGEVGDQGVDVLAHLGFDEAGKAALLLQARGDLHRPELDDLVDIPFDPAAVRRVPLQV